MVGCAISAARSSANVKREHAVREFGQIAAAERVPVIRQNVELRLPAVSRNRSRW
jgi:hypothetical protein